jgi:CRISPR/Cas system-associated endonuclease Cas1
MSEPSYAETIFNRQTENPAVLVADGHGLKIRVRTGHLVIEDGLGDSRRVRKIPRVPRTVTRLVILSPDGFVTLDALAWCADAGITVVQADRDGRVLMHSPGQSGDSQIRAEQALVSMACRYRTRKDQGIPADDRRSAAGLSVMRSLIAVKVHGQAGVLADVLRQEDPARMLHGMADRITVADSLSGLLTMEGSAAGSFYWPAWRDRVTVPFPPAELIYAPAHWITFKSRRSLYSQGLKASNRHGRHATDPVNAMLNYAYTVAETEARIACYTAGLDPALGFGHAGNERQDTLALDLLETLRPACDRAVLSFLDTGYGVPYDPATLTPRYLKLLWFSETRDGRCRLVAPLTHMLTERVIAECGATSSRYADSIVRILAVSASRKIQIPAALIVASSRQQRHAATRIPRIAASPDLTVADVIPDELWSRVSVLIPAAPLRRDGKRTRGRADDRLILAGLTGRIVHGWAWATVPQSWQLHRSTCMRRLAEWQESGAWETIVKELSASSRQP